MPNVKTKTILISVLFSAISQVSAASLGVKGEIYPVEETSIIIRMALDAAKVDWQSIGENTAKNTKEKLYNMPQTNFGITNETITFFVDPTVEASKDINAPVYEVDSTGKQALVWKTIVKKGQKVNPIRLGIIPKSRMLIFNPEDKKQKEFAVAAWKNYPQGIVLVVSGGDLMGLSKEIDYPVYYAYKNLIDRFKIKNVPSMIGTGCGENLPYVAVTEFSRKEISAESAADLIRDNWYGKGTSSCFPKS